MDALGRHILVEFTTGNPQVMDDVTTIEKAMNRGAELAGATLINSHFHHFSPYGVSGVVIIQESHLAIHTWPEYQYAAVDLFTCGDEVDPWLAFDHLKAVFEATNYSVIEMQRGPMSLLRRVPFESEHYRSQMDEKLRQLPHKRYSWFTDKGEHIALQLKGQGELLYDKTSEYQRTRVFETTGFGRALAIDHMMMCTDRDEMHYHEMIAHPAIFAHGQVKNVLVIGGGDGGTVREVLRHNSVEQVTLVEIDANVIEASKLHFPKLSSAFDHPKLNLIIDDGIAFVQKSQEHYDLIIVDGSDPVGPAEGLFSADFFSHCRDRLNPNGLLVAQGESPFCNGDVFLELNRCLKSVFGADHVNVMLYHIPTYPSGTWTFQVAQTGSVNIGTINEAQVASFVEAQSLYYYNAKIHRASLVLPNYLQKQLR